MPIWLRNLTFNFIEQYYNEQNNDNQEAEDTWLKGDAREAAKQNKVPSYVTKASKK